MENSSGRRLLDKFSQSQREWLQFWQTRSHAVIVIQLCAGRLHLQSNFWKKGRNFIWKTLDASSRTEDSTQKCLVIAVAPAAAARHIWECVFLHQETGAERERERNKMTQQITQNYLASGNLSEVLSHLLKKKSLNLKSTSELKELHKMWSWKMKRESDKFKWWKIEKWLRTKSIDEDLGQSEKSIKFSEESSRTIHELGNIELYEFGQISRTVQCHSCVKHIPGGIGFLRLRHLSSTWWRNSTKINARFQAMTVLNYVARVNYSRGTQHGEAQWQRWMPEEEHGKRVTTPSWSGGKRTERIDILREPMDGQKMFADTSTTSRRSTSPTPHFGTRGTGTRAPSRLFAMVMIAKLDLWKQEKISNPQRKFSQVFDKNKDDRILSFRRTR